MTKINLEEKLFANLLSRECPECEENLQDPIDIFSDVVVAIFGVIAIVSGIILLAINLI